MKQAGRYSTASFTISTALVWLTIVSTAPELSLAVQVFEDFDADPGWEGHNNRLVSSASRTVTQNFGYSLTNHVGLGTGDLGEIGGVFDRSPVEPAYYAEVIAPLTLNQALSFSGALSLLMASHTEGWTTSSDIYIGFFNSQEQGWRPRDFLGFRLRGHNQPSPNVASLELSYGTSAWTADGADWGQTILPNGARHDFQLNYNPNVANGQISLSWDGGQILTVDVRPNNPNHRVQGATFNRFGIFSNQLAGVAKGNKMEAYFDNLTVNGVPHNFHTNPGWEGVGNQRTFTDPYLYGINDFGYRATNRAGGSPGELGGLIWRVEDTEENLQAYYADDVSTLTLNDRLSASGKIAADRFSIDAGLMLGWFNASEQDWPPSNFVGVYMDSYTPQGRFFTPMYGTSAGNTKFNVPSLLLPPDGTSLNWTIEYDPDAAGGLGAITVTLDGVAQTLTLEPGHKAIGATLNRFGIFNMQDNNGKHAIIYLDDISYTSAVTQIEWGPDSSRNLNPNANWSPGLAPNSNELTAVLGDAITAPRVLFTDTPITLEGITFDNANKYTLAGLGTLTLESDDTSSASIQVLQGSHEFQMAISLADNLAVSVAGGSTLSINNLLDLNGFTLTKSGAGTLLINNVVRLEGGSIINSGSGALTILGGAVPEPSSMLLVMMAAAGMTLVRRRW